MQKSFNTKSKFILAFFVSLTTAGLQATQPNTNVNVENIDSEQLATILNTMNPQEQEQLVKLLEEVATVANSNKIKNENQVIRTLRTFFSKVPYTKLSGVALRVALAIICWEYVQPKLQERYKENPTSIELPKLVIGAIILDGIKDFLKEVRFAIEDSVLALFGSSQNDAIEQIEQHEEIAVAAA